MTVRPKRVGAAREKDREAGVSVVEVVLLAPLVVGFILVLVTFGLLVDVRGTVQGAARDAARAGSLQRDGDSALKAAKAAAESDLGTRCSEGLTVTSSPGFAPGQLYTIEVSCSISLTGVDWLNLGTQTIKSSSTAPLDVYRRAG
ncbi:MAG: TadE/TadG family type IV pilus assembly protein [Actinocrinis sp.]